MGIRALELARALRGAFDVVLLVPNAEEEAREAAGDLPVASLAAGGLAAAARAARAAVVSGHAASQWFREASGVPVAADLYDPFPIENLHYAPELGPEPSRHDRETLRLALARADFFLCASADQRLFYAGALYAEGRITAANFPEDPGLSRLLAVVPFGVPEAAPAGDRSRGRAAAGVPAEGPLVLFGGIYDWYEPELLLEAWPRVLSQRPEARLLFFESPNRETTPQSVCERARRRSRQIDPKGESIRFSPWLPYGERAHLYAATDLLVSICSEGLESDLAFRTRLLDAAWGGVPSVSVGGGALARELEEAEAGRRADRNAADLAEAVLGMLGDDGRAREAARRFAAGRSWTRVAEPLAAWCREARIDPGRLPFPEARSSSLFGRLLRRRE